MEKLAIIVGYSINYIIGGCFFITIAGFIYILLRISKLESTMANDRKKSGGRKEFTGSGFKKNPDVYSWEDTLAYMEDFNKIELKYSVFSQLIPVFPLFGILGTVAGLIQQLDNIQLMKEALAVSMSTTFWGLLAAIILKLIDAFLVSKEINKKELYFDMYEQDYQMSKDKYLQDSEK